MQVLLLTPKTAEVIASVYDKCEVEKPLNLCFE